MAEKGTVMAISFNAQIHKIRTLLSFAMQQSGNNAAQLLARVRSCLPNLQPPAHISVQEMQDLTASISTLEKADISDPSSFADQCKAAQAALEKIYQSNNSIASLKEGTAPPAPPSPGDDFERSRAENLEVATQIYYRDILQQFPQTMKQMLIAFRAISQGEHGPELKQHWEDKSALFLDYPKFLKILAFTALKKDPESFDQIEIFWYAHPFPKKLQHHPISIDDLLEGEIDSDLQPQLNQAIARIQVGFPRHGFFGLFHTYQILTTPSLSAIKILNHLGLPEEASQMMETMVLNEMDSWQDAARDLLRKCDLISGLQLAEKIYDKADDPLLLGQISWIYYKAKDLDKALGALLKTYSKLPPGAPRASYDDYLATLLQKYCKIHHFGPALDQMLHLARKIEDEDLRDALDFRGKSDYPAAFVKAVHDIAILRKENVALTLLWPQIRLQIGPDAPSLASPLEIRKWLRDNQERLEQVKSLALKGDPLTYLPEHLALFKEITHLKLEGFHLEHFPSWFPPTFLQIEELSLQNCGLAHISSVDPEKHFLHLKKLDLRNNPILSNRFPIPLCEWGGRPSFSALFLCCFISRSIPKPKIEAIIGRLKEHDQQRLYKWIEQCSEGTTRSIDDADVLRNALFKTVDEKLTSLSAEELDKVVEMRAFFEDANAPTPMQEKGNLVVSKEWLWSDPCTLMLALDLALNDIIILR